MSGKTPSVGCVNVIEWGGRTLRIARAYNIAIDDYITTFLMDDAYVASNIGGTDDVVYKMWFEMGYHEGRAAERSVK